MKLVSTKILALLSLIVIYSCSSDHHDPTIDEQIFTPNEPTAPKVTSIRYAGAFNSVYNWVFTYKGKNMTAGERTKQSGDASQSTGDIIKYTLSYGTKNVSINTLNSEITAINKTNGLLESLKYGDEICEYTYSGNELIRWESSYTLDGKTESTARYSVGDIFWENGNIVKIKYTPFTDADHKYYTYELSYYDNETNSNGVLPETIQKALGIEGVEFIYYSGMLGNGTKNLVESIKVTHSTDETLNETYKFNYRRSNGNVTYCNYQSESKGNNNLANINVVVTYSYN
jgi:hypothetical protein